MVETIYDALDPVVHGDIRLRASDLVFRSRPRTK